MKKKTNIILSVAILIVAIVITIIAFRPVQVSDTIKLDKSSYSKGKEYCLGKKDKFAFEFDVPKDGKLTTYILDSTTYIEENKKLEMEIIIKDHNNKVIEKKTVKANQAYVLTAPVKKGIYTVNIKLVNSTSDQNSINISWAYVSVDDGNTVKIDGRTATSLIDEKGIAKYNINIAKNMLIEISGGDACNPESSYTFSIIDEKGKSIASDIMVEETEWQSRKVFLPKGLYTIEMKNLIKNSIAECTVKSISNFEEIISDSTDFEVKKEKPICLGFTKNTSVPQNIKFITNGKDKELSIMLDGNNTYYDNVSSAKILVVDSNGKTVVDQIEEEYFSLDISDFNGTYFIYISPNDNDNFVVNVSIN